MKQYSYKKKTKIGTIIGIILLIMLLGASISVLGMATKGFKTKPSIENIKNLNNDINKKKDNKKKEEKKENKEKELKEIEKLTNSAITSMMRVDLRDGKELFNINKEAIAAYGEYGDKETEVYKELAQLTNNFDPEYIKDLKVNKDKGFKGYFLYTLQQYLADEVGSSDDWKRVLDGQEDEFLKDIKGFKKINDETVISYIEGNKNDLENRVNFLRKIFEAEYYINYFAPVVDYKTCSEDQMLDFVKTSSYKNELLYTEKDGKYKSVEEYKTKYTYDMPGNVFYVPMVLMEFSLECRGKVTNSSVAMFLNYIV